MTKLTKAQLAAQIATLEAEFAEANLQLRVAPTEEERSANEYVAYTNGYATASRDCVEEATTVSAICRRAFAEALTSETPSVPDVTAYQLLCEVHAHEESLRNAYAIADEELTAATLSQDLAAEKRAAAEEGEDGD